MTLVPGEANDIVNVYIDGVQKACGTTWENYYRYDQEQAGSGNVVSPIDRLIIQARGTSTLALAEVPAADRGFLIDNVTTTTTEQGQAVACPLPVDPQAGVQGTTGTQGATGHTGAQGAAGAAGTTTVIHETATPTLVGNTIRTLNAPRRRGEKFVSLRAYLLTPSGLHRLPARRRAISVDLRNKPVGNYNIIIKARYRKSNGVVHTVRTTRNLSVAVA